jgi:DNA invertase Pin-like site-specific DNA recombinase
MWTCIVVRMDTLIYLRRSVVDENSPGVVSYEQQLARCQDIARGHGAAAPEVLADWGRSGGEGLEHRRSGYQDLRERITAGRVRWVVSYDLSRLSRSTRETLDLVDLASKHGAKVHVGDLGILDPSDPTGRFTLTALSGANTLLRDMAKKRGREIAATRKAQGLQVGRPPYGDLPGEDVAVVLAAFDRAGSYHDAARALNVAKVQTRGGNQWYGTSVRRVVVRSRGAQMAARPRIRSRAAHALSGLLVCHCGGPMSVTRSPGGALTVCGRGVDDPGHSRPVYMSQAKLLPWVMAEADRLRVPEAVEREVVADEHRRTTLTKKRERIIDTYADGAIDKADRDRRLSEVDAEVDKLDATSVVLQVPAIDWTADPDQINGILRLIFRSIQLGPDLLPVSADWTAPDLRSGLE